MNKQTVRASLVIVGILVVSSPLHAQKLLEKAAEAALTRKVITTPVRKFNRALGVEGFALDPLRGTAGYSPLFGYGKYNPVVGYKLAHMQDTRFHPYEMFHPYKGVQKKHVEFEEELQLQVAPVTARTAGLDKFIIPAEQATLAQLTEGIYLWRLNNPSIVLAEDGFLASRARALITENEKYLLGFGTCPPDEICELPNVTFLTRLLDPKFTPKTYGQLAEETKVYPKHVTLNADGFPVPTAEAEQARILDNYLMLSHPNVMGPFNTANEIAYGKSHQLYYTPFVLTREELAAAEELLAKRHEITKVPDNATPRQLLELAYNRLETHTAPYNNPELMANGIFAYPNYKSTKLYRKIKEVINQADQSPWRESTDVSHLVVLNTIMGEEAHGNPDVFFRTLDAFEKLCRETPSTPENIAHLQLLHDVLVHTPGFWEFVDPNGDGWLSVEEEQVPQMRERIFQFARTPVTEWTAPKVNR